MQLQHKLYSFTSDGMVVSIIPFFLYPQRTVCKCTFGMFGAAVFFRKMGLLVIHGAFCYSNTRKTEKEIPMATIKDVVRPGDVSAANDSRIEYNMSDVMARNRRFYDEYVADLIHRKFGRYEERIAVGIVGEGSDCFGYDDLISRDHDFGTGVCLWLTNEDMDLFGYSLSIAYNELVDSIERANLTDRIRERRGVMRIHDFYSNILRIDCDTDFCRMTESDWYSLDHSCLKTATNGQVFRDDLGVFTAFRNLLLQYYPERVWRRRIAEQLHIYAASLQVNYARCMTRGDIVAAELCRAQGLSAVMELFFLLHREYPPYYKWTFRALQNLDEEGTFSEKVQELAETCPSREAWKGTAYHPNRLNYKDRIISIAEEFAYAIVKMLQEHALSDSRDLYLERHVNVVLGNQW